MEDTPTRDHAVHVPTSRIQILTEVFIVLSAGALVAATFFSYRRFTVYEDICLIGLILFRIVTKGKKGKSIPRWVIAVVMLYLTSEIIGALMSSDISYAVKELRRFTHLFVAGLLFTVPLSSKSRSVLMTVFFCTAAIAGVAGILQYFGIVSTAGVYGGIEQGSIRSRGFSSNAILYASILAVVCSSSIVVLFSGRKNFPMSPVYRWFLLIIAVLTLSGILLSGSRGVWVALCIACLITLFIYKKQLSLLFAAILAIICIIVFSMNPYLRGQAKTIVASMYSKDKFESRDVRLELWKGSWLIFKEHPLLGVGTWNYESAVDEYIRQGRLKPLPVKMHAHSIYFHALATRGIIGFVLTIVLIVTIILWGRKEIKENSGFGGYVIILIAVLAAVGGLTEINLDINQILAANCLAIGIMGPIDLPEREDDTFTSKSCGCSCQ